MSNVHRLGTRFAIIANVLACMSACTVNTFNCNVKEACRPDSSVPAPSTAR